jgi:hypothetical protein
VYNASHAVVVRVGITLTQIFDMVSTCCCHFFTLSATPGVRLKGLSNELKPYKTQPYLLDITVLGSTKAYTIAFTNKWF